MFAAFPPHSVSHYTTDPLLPVSDKPPLIMTETKESFDTFIYYFGLTLFWLIFGIIALRLVLFIWRDFMARGVQWCGGPHTWAVITGATDGIGLEYARQLADKGYNLLLMSRSQTKLDKVREEITSKHPNQVVKVLAIDFGRLDIYDRIAKELECLEEVHVLVNNVGIFSPGECPWMFLEVPELDRFITNTININMNACTRMIALVMPSMVSRGRGVVINLSSMFGDSPKPLMALYAASKAYVDHLSRALQEEYYLKGVVVQTVIPGFVKTKMAQTMSLPGLFFPTAPTFVKAALNSVGRQTRTSVYFGHRVMHFGFKLVDFWSDLLGVDLSVKMHRQIGLAIGRDILKKQKNVAG